jgi:ABC-type multidrug transport system fused ATPase/permease subunit
MKASPKFLDQESQFRGQYSKTVFETLWLAYKPYKGRMLLCLILGLSGRLVLLGNANLIGKWVDSLAHPEANNWSWSSTDYIFILSLFTLVGFVATTLFRIGFSRLSARAVSQIYDEVTLRTSRFPMSFFDSTPAGRIITRFSSDYGNVFRLFGGPLAEFLAIIFDLIGMVILISLASPLYLILVAAMALLNFAVYRAHRQQLRDMRRDLSASRSPSIAHFAETAQGASTIRTFNKEMSFSKRFQSLDQDYLSQKLKTTSGLLKYSFKMNSLTALLLLGTGISAYFWVQNGWVTIGSVGVALSFVALSGTTVQMFFEWMAQFEEAMVGMERLDGYIRKPLEEHSRLPAASQFPTGHPVFISEQEERQKSKIQFGPQARVQFSNVWFRYRDNLPFVLKGLNLDIQPGERFGIVGRTGSGKSSLIQALFHLYPLTEGQISVDGQRPGTMDLISYRKSLAFISQDSILFKGILRENLDLEGRFYDNDLFAALTRVGLEEFASTAGLLFEIEERGRNLSLGEKQLLCMARCLLQNAPVVIMDEATSSVDPQSEEILVRATEEFFAERTQIIIAHRLSTLKKCDRILWLEQGQIKMIGSPQEVLPSFGHQ